MTAFERAAQADPTSVDAWIGMANAALTLHDRRRGVRGVEERAAPSARSAGGQGHRRSGSKRFEAERAVANDEHGAKPRHCWPASLIVHGLSIGCRQGVGSVERRGVSDAVVRRDRDARRHRLRPPLRPRRRNTTCPRSWAAARRCSTWTTTAFSTCIWCRAGASRSNRPAAGNRLYRNRGDGTFEDVTERSGAGVRGYGMGVAAGDFDNDGYTDLYVTSFGHNVLLKNDGHGHFIDVTAKAGVASSGWSTSAAFLDYDGDGCARPVRRPLPELAGRRPRSSVSA